MSITAISSLQPHQQRVVAEQEAIHAQATALQNFINGDVFPTVDAAEQARLLKQNQLQWELHAVLGERIEYFKSISRPA